MATSLTEKSANSAPSDPVNILLVDDQQSRLLTYRTVLGDLHENLIEANSGTEALRLLMSHDFALILLDVNMPILDGFETATLIHQHPRFEKTPIIFVSAINVSDLDRMRGYRLGAVDYVMVPIVPEILRGKVVVLTELFRKRRELEMANRQLAAANEALRTEKAREREELNISLQAANAALENRNAELHAEIAERVRMETTLLDQDRRKDEFLAVLAHELRNPLAAVSNAAHAFRISFPSSERLHDIMTRQLSLLVRLIDDLLDVARIRRGKLTLREDLTSMHSIVNAALETVMPQLLSSGHSLENHLQNEDLSLFGDRDRLAQVFSNLISNAAKYSAPGSTIRIEGLAVEKCLEISIVDQGIGLTQEQQAWIFDLFAQVDTTLERARGGLGIGLTLARNIVEMHRGQLMVHSEGLGLGSQFTVRLPYEKAAELPSERTSPTKGRQPRCRVLVVDDNRDSADTLHTVLDYLGHSVCCIYDSKDALSAADSFRPDVAFLDIGMPGLTGYDIARLFRSRDIGTGLVLVALTGWGQSEDRRKTSEAGFDFHLVKPAAMSDIQGIFEKVIPQKPGLLPSRD